MDHYIWQGVEHFYLIDDNSNDNPLIILNNYINKGIISYYKSTKIHNQIGNYRDIFDRENLKYKTKWLIICDLDEFYYGC